MHGIGQPRQAIQQPTMFIAPSSARQVVPPRAVGMMSHPTPQSSMIPPNDELEVSESPDYHDPPNMMSDLNSRLVQTIFSDSPTSVRSFASPGITNTGYMEPSGLSGGPPYRRQPEAATTTQWQYCPSPSFSTHENYTQVNTVTVSDNTVNVVIPMMSGNASRSQNTYTHPPTANVLQSRSYGNPFQNPQSFHGAQYHHPVQGGVGVGLSGSPATGINPPPSCSPPMQYLNGYPHYPQYYMPNTDVPSSSYAESSTHDFEAYHGLHRQQWHNYAMCYPQPAAGPSVLRHPTVPSPSTTANSQPYTSRGGEMGCPSSLPPPIQPHQDPPRSNPRPRQSSRRHRRSHTQDYASTTFTCEWDLGNNTSCGFEGALNAFKTHFTTSHLSGAQDAPIKCQWQGCTYCKRGKSDVRVMRRDCLWRHVLETHLKMKRNV
ncbi:hypothetical protein DFH29DRAFT_1001991 [Suillus ampliporus]|nr:hypothetical protein DFH29DRAFT_1001991 [Suillus ampliporus]